MQKFLNTDLRWWSLRQCELVPRPLSYILFLVPCPQDKIDFYYSVIEYFIHTTSEVSKPSKLYRLTNYQVNYSETSSDQKFKLTDN